MAVLYAQGDILIERLDDAPLSGVIVPPEADGCTVIAEGEIDRSSPRHFRSGDDVPRRWSRP